MDDRERLRRELQDIAAEVRRLAERARRAEAATTAYLLEMAALDAEALARRD